MIYIGSDHGGYKLKEYIKTYFEEQDVLSEDVGIYTEESYDYPLIAKKLCDKVLEDQSNQGILICGTGVGVSIVANKIRGIRAALCNDAYIAQMCRRHNNANVLCMGGRVLSKDEGVKIVKEFLSTDFEGGRHQRRVNQINQIEKM